MTGQNRTDASSRSGNLVSGRGSGYGTGPMRRWSPQLGSAAHV